MNPSAKSAPTYSAIADAAKAILAVKMLGKVPAGSEVIATPANLSTCWRFPHRLRTTRKRPLKLSDALPMHFYWSIPPGHLGWQASRRRATHVSVAGCMNSVITINVQLIHWWLHRNRLRLIKFLSHLASCFSAPCPLPLALYSVSRGK